MGTPEIRNMMRKTGVDVFEADQCMCGLKTWGKSRSQLVLAKKPTKFMTNSRAIGRELTRKCDGSHEHQLLIDGRAHAAARYPAALCKAMCRGIIKEQLQRSLDVRTVVEIQEGEHWRSLDLEENHEEEETDAAMYATTPGDLCEETEHERRMRCEEGMRHEKDPGHPPPWTCSSAGHGLGKTGIKDDPERTS